MKTVLTLVTLVVGALTALGVLTPREQQVWQRLEPAWQALIETEPSASPLSSPTLTTQPEPVWLPLEQPDVLRTTLEVATVAAVIDGDTIRLTDGRRVRYIGVDTPETKHPQRGVECFGQEAADANQAWVEGRTVGLVRDVSDTDRYDRLLRYVYLLDTTASPTAFVNAELVARGYAQANAYPPDVRYAERFTQVEASARQEQRGLWHPEACIR